MAPNSIKLACVAGGKLFFVDGNGKTSEHESRFARDAESRMEKSRQRNAWKEETSNWNQQPAIGSMLGQFQQASQPRAQSSFTGVASGPDGVSYSMDVMGAGGLFHYNIEQTSERRLLHRNNFHPQGINTQPHDGTFAFALADQDGAAHLSLVAADAPQVRQLTSGDSCDESPTWHTEDDRWYLYFHSTPVGRSDEGFALGRGPGKICRIGIESGDVETLYEDPNFDYLQPRLDAAGNLFAIRRPYESMVQRPANDLWTTVKDFFLFPFRFVRMLFYIANFLSLMMVGKPLSSQDLSQSPQGQALQRTVWGRALKTQKSIRDKGQKGRLKLVPDNWELVQLFNSDQPAQVIAKNVIAFSVSDDGRVVYSDGSGVYEVVDGSETKLCGLANVEQFVLL